MEIHIQIDFLLFVLKGCETQKWRYSELVSESLFNTNQGNIEALK